MVAKTKSAYEALSKVQANLNAPKGQRNSFGNYNYRSCEDILQAVKPLLGDAVILVSDEIKLIGSRFYVVATAKFILGDTVIENTAYAREPEFKKGMDEAQITGATSSYARKYALNGLLLIDDNKDADTQKPEDNCSQTNQQTAQHARGQSVKAGSLAQVMSEGNDFASVEFWRSLTQPQMEAEWKLLDKDSQKHLKKLIAEHPVPMEQAS